MTSTVFLARLPSAPRHRLYQFLWALSARLTSGDRSLVDATLPAPLATLFYRMSRGEQAHSVRVLRALLARGETHPDLLQAALLHDAGKTQAPLRLWERVLIVLVRSLAPGLAARWGHGAATGWRKPFVTAARHPDWGANLAASAGASPLTVALIRRHQHAGFKAGEDRLLALLQQADSDC